LKGFYLIKELQFSAVLVTIKGNNFLCELPLDLHTAVSPFFGNPLTIHPEQLMTLKQVDYIYGKYFVLKLT
jgi:hypothetical protein